MSKNKIIQISHTHILFAFQNFSEILVLFTELLSFAKLELFLRFALKADSSKIFHDFNGFGKITKKIYPIQLH
jgi:hypothetical protein